MREITGLLAARLNPRIVIYENDGGSDEFSLSRNTFPSRKSYRREERPGKYFFLKLSRIPPSSVAASAESVDQLRCTLSLTVCSYDWPIRDKDMVLLIGQWNACQVEAPASRSVIFNDQYLKYFIFYLKEARMFCTIYVHWKRMVQIKNSLWLPITIIYENFQIYNDNFLTKKFSKYAESLAVGTSCVERTRRRYLRTYQRLASPCDVIQTFHKETQVSFRA